MEELYEEPLAVVLALVELESGSAYLDGNTSRAMGIRRLRNVIAEDD
jgi:hypothetical protein